ncbi:MAG TPA: MerR family transcriptional regulator [Isosphaeraceae bacterium]|nr:MerR family transcriptional regulator [Isosphaeraceae bacterium]
MSGLEDRSGYSIAAVSKLTGVSCHALRVWERRYGFPVPRRSPSGHRRYGADQVEHLRLIARLLQEGRSVGELMADLSKGQLLLDTPTPEPLETAHADLLNYLEAGDLPAAEREFRRITEGLSVLDQIERVIEPALVDAGERWFQGRFEVFHERCASTFLREKLSERLHEAREANRNPQNRVVVGTMQGDRHEGGVLIVSLLLELKGWRALTLGTDLPVEEFQKAIDAWKPRALCLSFVLSRNINKRFGELESIHGVPIYVGGRSILNYRSLAKKHGLRPVPGPGSSAVDLMIEELQQRPER